MSIRPQRKNANRHTPRGMGLLEASIGQDGWIGAVTVAADGETFDGSARVEVVGQNGMLDDAIVVETDGRRPIVVKRTDIPSADDPRAKRLGVAANRVAELNLEWEPDVLRDLAGELDLSGLFSPDELSDLAMPSLPEAGAGGDEFDATPEDGPTRAQLGDLWIIGGKHRLLVGDCTDAANVARLMGGERAVLMFTDPPYGVAYSGRGQSTQHQTIENDDLDLPALKEFLLKAFSVANEVMADGCVAYVCHADRPRGTRPVFETAFTDVGWKFSATVIWVKQQASMGWQDYRAQHEPLLYGWKRGEHYYCGDRAQTTVWEISRDAAADYEHPTQKPVALPMRAIENSSKPGDLVYEPFSGSGSTLIAGHRLGRTVYGLELEPRYADVILRRAEAEGLTVERADG